jgi:predicted nucleic acid-binding protein
VLSNPSYPTIEARPEEVISRLGILCAGKDHAFWTDDISLLNESVFRAAMIAGHRQITDIYLLGLAVSRQGTLATFDRSIPVNAVVGAGPQHLELLG